MPEGHHCTRTGHPLSVGGYFLCGTHDFENRGPVQNGGIQCGQPGYLTPYSPVLHDFAEQKEIKDLSAAPYVAVFRPCRRISSGPSSFSERPAPEAALVNGLAVDARALGSDLAALISA